MLAIFFGASISRFTFGAAPSFPAGHEAALALVSPLGPISALDVYRCQKFVSIVVNSTVGRYVCQRACG